MTRLLLGTRYLILFPILGLALAAVAFFVFGGIGLISLLFELVFFFDLWFWKENNLLLCARLPQGGTADYTAIRFSMP